MFTNKDFIVEVDFKLIGKYSIKAVLSYMKCHTCNNASTAHERLQNMKKYHENNKLYKNATEYYRYIDELSQKLHSLPI